jgi:hypothetical protein
MNRFINQWSGGKQYNEADIKFTMGQTWEVWGIFVPFSE